MNPEDAKDLIKESIHQALKDKFEIDPDSINGAVASHIQNASERIAEELTGQFAQREFDFLANNDPDLKDQPAQKVSPKNNLNELTGAEWLWFTKSVLRTSYPSILGHELRRKQGGNKPPQLMQELIEFFTKPEDLVLDPFAGAGGTALGAHLAGRRSINLELNPESIEIYHQVCKQEGITPHEFHFGDCRELLQNVKDESIDFIATDPPYSPELEMTMSGDRANKKYDRQNRKSSYITYSDDPRDLSKISTFNEFFEELTSIGKQLLRVLKPSRYLAMILRDAYQESRYIPTSAIIGVYVLSSGVNYVLCWPKMYIRSKKPPITR